MYQLTHPGSTVADMMTCSHRHSQTTSQLFDMSSPSSLYITAPWHCLVSPEVERFWVAWLSWIREPGELTPALVSRVCSTK